MTIESEQLKTPVELAQNLLVIPKPSADADARQGGLVAGGIFVALGLFALILQFVDPGSAMPGATLLLSGALMAAGLVVGGSVYALQAPSVLSLDGDELGLRGSLIRRHVSTMQIRAIVRVCTGRALMPAYVFVTGRWLGLGDITILAAHYDRDELERLIAATGRPVDGDFTQRV